MFADDIKALFSQVRVGTPVRVINQPVKYATEPDGRRYVEVHRPLSQSEGQNTQTMRYTLPANFTQFTSDKGTDKALVDKAMYRRAGYPILVAAGATPVAQGGAVQSAQNVSPAAQTTVTQ